MKYNRTWSNGDFLVAALFLLVIGIITFLPLAGQLGYYRDDWHVTYAGTVHGPLRIIDEHKIDRPFMGLTYAATYAVLGNHPLAWQLYAFAIKLGAALALLWLARLLWPQQRTAAAMMALLLLVYPGFLQWAAAHSHQNFMLSFALMLLSIALSVRALQSRTGARLGWTALAVVTGLAGYLITEYMIGLEAVRGLVLGYLIWRDGYRVNLRQGLKLLRRWLPYLAAALVYLVWRLVIYESGRPATDISAVGSRYLTNPVGMLARLVISTGRDLIDTVFLAWGVPLYNLFSTASYSGTVFSVVLALVAAALLLLFLRLRPAGDDPIETPDETNWPVHAMWLGLGSALLALLPIIAANRTVTFADTFDRYTQPASVGAAIFAAGAVYYLCSARSRRVALAFLLMIGVMTHYHNAASFRTFWDYQKDIWWQLSWRAPALKDGTTLVFQLPPGYRLSEGYETWAPASLIFTPDSKEILVSGEALNRETVVEAAAGVGYGREFRSFDYEVDFELALVASMPRSYTCLHVYDGQNIELAATEDPLVRLIAQISRIDLIDVDGPGYTPPEIIFGKEPERGWCYYYQKASLARQQGNFEEVVRLGREAQSLRLRPQDVSEWMPFYEAYIRTRNRDEANVLATRLRHDFQFLRPYCLAHPRESLDPADELGVNLVVNLCGE